MLMKFYAQLIPLLGATCLVAFAGTTPAEARPKPCCYNNGDYFESSPSTCRRYGGVTVEQEYCGRYDDRYYDRGYRRSSGPDVGISIRLGDVVIAYSDGYYDRHRRWHRWRDARERRWYRQYRSGSYYDYDRERDRDRRRRDWRDGRRDDWR
jgi:hypothetical protein